MVERSMSCCNVSNIQGVCGYKSISSSILLSSSSDPPCWGEGAGPVVTRIVHGSNCFTVRYDVIGISGWPISSQIIYLSVGRSDWVEEIKQSALTILQFTFLILQPLIYKYIFHSWLNAHTKLRVLPGPISYWFTVTGGVSLFFVFVFCEIRIRAPSRNNFGGWRGWGGGGGGRLKQPLLQIVWLFEEWVVFPHVRHISWRVVCFLQLAGHIAWSVVWFCNLLGTLFWRAVWFCNLLFVFFY